MGRALSLDSVCICQAVPQQSDKLLECHTKDCQSGKFFHLTCLGYRKMPNNSKTTWKCTNCKKSNAKPFHDSSAVPVSAGQENPATTNTCSSQFHDSKPEFIELDMHKILTVKGKVLMTLKLPWLQLVNLKDIVHLEISKYKITS